MNQHIETAASKMEDELCINKVRAKELIADFLHNLPEQFTEIEKSLAKPDVLSAITHSVKGTGGNLRLTKIYEAAREFDEAVKEKKTESFVSSYKKLKEAYKETIS